MSIEIVINATREETRVAVLEQRVATELYIDRKKDRGIVGNVYKGRVVKVLPGMQAAFVDIGLEKSAFLYVGDIVQAAEEGLTEEEGLVSDVIPLAVPDVKPEDKPEAVLDVGRPHRPPPIPIEQLLSEGHEIVVQVSKESMGTKGPRITGYVSLPRRYLVLMPTVDHIGISRRIEGEEERNRLKEVIARLKKPGMGYIVRTVSEGVREEDLRADVQFLERLWEDICRKAERLSAPSLLHTDLDLTFRAIRDLFTKRVDRLVIDSKEEYGKILEFVESYLPDLASRVTLYEGEDPIFDTYGIEMEISRALGRRVWLKSGGYIVIDHAEALTVIDVNTGRFVGKRDLEETILKTNLEAAKEIAYQLRLRNIGGIIMIDFIDMEKEKNRERVFAALQEALAADRARTHILKISELGLVEMSRERVRENVQHILCEPCPYCEGKGFTKSPTSVCYEIFREVRRSGTDPLQKTLIIAVHPSVAALLYDEERLGVEELERTLARKIVVKADPNMHVEQFDIVPL